MDDLISRQAAINKINERKRKMIYCFGFENDMVKIMDIARSIIIAMPSAQQEIIRCKDCKHFELDKPYVVQGIPVLGHEVCNAWGEGCKTDLNGFCFMGERREDG